LPLVAIALAVAPASAEGHFSTRVLSPLGSVRQVAAAAGGGRTAVVWTRLTKGVSYVEARLGRRGRGFGPVQRLGSRASTAPVIAAGAGGTVVAAWRQPRRRSGLVVAVAAPGRRFGPPRRLDIRGRLGGVAVDPRGRSIVAWGRGPHRLRYAVGTPNGRFKPPRSLAVVRMGWAATVRVAADRAGALLIAWTAQAGKVAVQGRVATVDARSGRLGRAATVGPLGEPVYNLVLATGPGGAAAADQAYAAGSLHLSAVLRPDSGAWGRPETVASMPVPLAEPTFLVQGPELALPADAPAVAVWQTIRFGGSDENPYPDRGEVLAASRQPHGWSAPVTLSRSGVLPGPPTAIAVRDTALVGWPEPAPGGRRMRVAILGPAGPGDAPLTLPGGDVRGLVALADAGDRALAAWVAERRVRATEIAVAD
jgi:hypothetical protein